MDLAKHSTPKHEKALTTDGHQSLHEKLQVQGVSQMLHAKSRSPVLSPIHGAIAPKLAHDAQIVYPLGRESNFSSQRIDPLDGVVEVLGSSPSAPTCSLSIEITFLFFSC